MKTRVYLAIILSIVPLYYYRRLLSLSAIIIDSLFTLHSLNHLIYR